MDKPRGSVASLLEKFSQADESSKQAKIRDERMSSVRTSVGNRVSDRVSSGPWTASATSLTSNGACRPSLNDNNILPVQQSGPEPKKPLKDWLSVSPIVTGRKSPSEIISADLEKIWGAKLAGVRANGSEEKSLPNQQKVPLTGTIKPPSSLPAQQDRTTSVEHTIESKPTKANASLDSTSAKGPSDSLDTVSHPPAAIKRTVEKASLSADSNQIPSSAVTLSEQSATACELKPSPRLTPAKTTPVKSARATDPSIKTTRGSVSAASSPKKSTTSSATLTTQRKSHPHATPPKTEASLPRSRASTADRNRIAVPSQHTGNGSSVQKAISPRPITTRTTVISSTSRLYSPTASSLAKLRSPALSPSSSSSTTIQKSPLSASRTSLQSSASGLGESKAIGSSSVSSRSLKTIPIGSTSKTTPVSSKQQGRATNTPSSAKPTSKRLDPKSSSISSGQTTRPSQSPQIARPPAQKPSSTSAPRTRTSSKPQTLKTKARPTTDVVAPKDDQEDDVFNVVKDDVLVNPQEEANPEIDQTEIGQD